METQDCCRMPASDAMGKLPACAPLAAAYVPVQSSGSSRYGKTDALIKGTLFPGLDLPWKNVANESLGVSADTPEAELMALAFVVHELGLYLDTHPNDSEAAGYFREYSALLAQGRESYAAEYGPLQQTQIGRDSFDWINNPWPWDYPSEGGKR